VDASFTGAWLLPDENSGGWPHLPAAFLFPPTMPPISSWQTGCRLHFVPWIIRSAWLPKASGWADPGKEKVMNLVKVTPRIALASGLRHALGAESGSQAGSLCYEAPSLRYPDVKQHSSPRPAWMISALQPARYPLFGVLILGALLTSLPAQSKPRARDLGVPFEGTPGALNSITDVAGVLVGVARGSGDLGRHAQ